MWRSRPLEGGGIASNPSLAWSEVDVLKINDDDDDNLCNFFHEIASFILVINKARHRL